MSIVYVANIFVMRCEQAVIFFYTDKFTEKKELKEKEK